MAKERADVILSWYWENGVTNELRSKFVRPTRFLQMKAGPGTDYATQLVNFGQTAIQNLIRARLPDVEPLRVAVMGFSEGCRGAREALKCGDAGRLDAIFAIDGIHTQWIKPRETFETGLLLPWRAIAQRSVQQQGGPLTVITTSDVQPAYVDTTTTSSWIWQQATGTEEIFYDQEIPPWLMGPVVPPFTNPPGSFGPGQASWKATTYSNYPLRAFRKSNNLWIVNYYNLDATGVGDHIFQAERVSPLVYHELLIKRWNEQEPEKGILMGPSKEPAFLTLGKAEVGKVLPLPYPQPASVDAPEKEDSDEDKPMHPDANRSSFAWGSFLAGMAVGAAGGFIVQQVQKNTTSLGKVC